TDILARIAIGIELRLGRRAFALAGALIVGEPALHCRIGNREIVAVAGAHADGTECAGGRAVAARVDDAGGTAEQRIEETTRARSRGRRAVLGSAIVLGKFAEQLPALAFLIVVVAALEPLEIAHGAIEAVAQLLNLRVERLAFRRLAGKQREKSVLAAPLF